MSYGRKVLKMELITDNYNSLYDSDYVLEIFYLVTPDFQSYDDFPNYI